MVCDTSDDVFLPDYDEVTYTFDDYTEEDSINSQWTFEVDDHGSLYAFMENDSEDISEEAVMGFDDTGNFFEVDEKTVVEDKVIMDEVGNVYLAEEDDSIIDVLEVDETGDIALVEEEKEDVKVVATLNEEYRIEAEDTVISQGGMGGALAYFQ